MNDVAQILHDAHRILGGSLLPGVATPVVITWDVWPSGSVPDPVDGSHTGTRAQGTMTVNGLVHTVQPGTSKVRIFNEAEVGDLIVEFPADVPLDGKENLVFTVKGQAYVQKEVSEKLAQSWDATLGDRRMFRTMLLRAKT